MNSEQQLPSNFTQGKKTTTFPWSSAFLNTTPLNEFTNFYLGYLTNISHDLWDTFCDLLSRMSSVLTPDAAGVSFASIQSHIPPPINIPCPYPEALSGPFLNTLSQFNDCPPHISQFANDTYVSPHRSLQNPSRYHGNSSPEQPLREPNRIPSIRFSGPCVKFETFVLDIWEQSWIISDSFSSEKACINCVAHHFGVQNENVGQMSYTWFMGLLWQNAYKQRAVTGLQDLCALPYVLLPLTTLAKNDWRNGLDIQQQRGQSHWF